jgi:uncharacterized protein (DUF934 family)
MPLLENGRFVADTWRSIGADEALPLDDDIIVPLARLEEALGLDRHGRLGVRLEPAAKVEQVAPHLGSLDLVALAFPVFSDGRAFSTARLLRDRYGFEGTLRAVGQVLVDQYQYMRQVGFDSFEVAEGRALESWRSASVEVPLAYQTDYRDAGVTAIWRARRQALAIAAE